MFRTLATTAVIAVGVLIIAVPANAAKDSDKCHFAWEDRNAVFKAKNYCFKTARAKAWFGPNAIDCKTTVHLSASDKRQIKDAQRREKMYC